MASDTSPCDRLRNPGRKGGSVLEYRVGDWLCNPFFLVVQDAAPVSALQVCIYKL